MPNITNSRANMIGSLVEHSVTTAISDAQQDWLKDLFEKGFVGYNKLTDRQLLHEMELHGLIPDENLFEYELVNDLDDDHLYEPFFH
jgi:hypothetical protein